MLDFRVENDQYDASLPMLIFINIQEEFEDTKGVVNSINPQPR